MSPRHHSRAPLSAAIALLVRLAGLRCLGACAGAGSYPVQLHPHDDAPLQDSERRMAGIALLDGLTLYEFAEARRQQRTAGRRRTGFYFIPCEGCLGTGRRSWRAALSHASRRAVAVLFGAPMAVGAR